MGTAAIASAGSVTEVFSRGLASEARVLLGGDVMFSVRQRQFTQDEREFIADLGTVTESVGLDMMASAGDRRRQVNLRGVDKKYPLVGTVRLSGGEPDFQQALAQRHGRWGAVVSQSFLDAFEVNIGDPVEFGQIKAIITARLDSTPDRVGTPGSFSPEAMLSFEPVSYTHLTLPTTPYV